MDLMRCDLLTLEEAVRLYGTNEQKRDLIEDGAIYRTTANSLYEVLQQHYMKVSYTIVNFIGKGSEERVFICKGNLTK